MKKTLYLLFIWLLSFGIFTLPVKAISMSDTLVAVINNQDNEDDSLEEEEEEEILDEEDEEELDEENIEDNNNSSNTEENSSGSGGVKKTHIDVDFPEVGGETANCDSLRGVFNALDGLYTLIKIAAPLLVIVLSTMDYIKALANQNADELKKVNRRTIKRVVIGLLVFFLPNLLDLLFKVFGLYNINGCNIGK